MNNEAKKQLSSFLLLVPFILMLFTIRDYLYLLTGTAKGLPGWASFFIPVFIWLILINIEPFSTGPMRKLLSLVMVASVFLALIKWSTLITYELIYNSIASIKTDDMISTKNVKIFAGTILTLPGIITGSLLGATVYYLKNNPLVKYILEDYKLTEGFSWKASVSQGNTGTEKPDIELCVDKATKEKVYIPFADAFRHIFVLGPTGCGKTSLFLIPMALQFVKNENIGLLVMDPKGDFAHYVAAMCRHYNRPHILLDPTLENCPYANPLVGDESDVIENLVTSFEMLTEGSSTYFKDQDSRLLRNTVRMLKRIYGDDATLLMINDVFNNIEGFGMECIIKLSRLEGDPEFVKQNQETVNYFKEHYFNPQTRTFMDTSAIRNQIANLIDNKYLRKVLNPPPGVGSDVNFDEFLKNGGVIAVSLAQGPLRGLARYFGLFIQMSFQSAVFRRPLPEWSRRPCYEIIDEMQVVANEQFAEMVQQARSLACSVIAATQSLDQIVLKLGNKGKAFLSAIKTNFKNMVIFAGLPPEDATIFSNWSGLKMEERITESVSKSQFSFLHGFDKMRAPQKSKSVTEQEKPVLSTDEIIYLDAKEVVYFISKNMKIERPRIGEADWLPADIHKIIKTMVEENLPNTNGKNETIDKPDSPESGVIKEVVEETSETVTVFDEPVYEEAALTIEEDEPDREEIQIVAEEPIQTDSNTVGNNEDTLEIIEVNESAQTEEYPEEIDPLLSPNYK